VEAADLLGRHLLQANATELRHHVAMQPAAGRGVARALASLDPGVDPLLEVGEVALDRVFEFHRPAAGFRPLVERIDTGGDLSSQHQRAVTGVFEGDRAEVVDRHPAARGAVRWAVGEDEGHAAAADADSEARLAAVGAVLAEGGVRLGRLAQLLERVDGQLLRGSRHRSGPLRFRLTAR